MASSYSTQLRVELMATGEKDATWGTINNTSIELLEASIAGRAAVTHDDTANYTLTTANGSDDEARHMILNIGGALSAARNAVVPTQSKVYIVKNATTGGYAVTVKTSGGTGISVPNGKTMILFCDGTNVVESIDYAGGLTLGGAIIGAVSQDVFNTVSTTVNAFGAASVALNIGHASAAAAFPGGISIPTGKSLAGAGTAAITGFAITAPVSASGTVYSATYTPTLTNTTNLAASTAYACQFMRVGNVVTVAGRVDIDATIAGAIVLGMTLPVSSNFSQPYQLGGAGANPGNDIEAMSFLSDVTNDRATMQGLVVNTANHSINFTFSYLVI